MSIFVPPEFEEFLQEKVKSGLYLTPEAVIRDALQLLEERDRLRAMRLVELRKEIAIGLDQIERGEEGPLDLDEIMAEADRGLEQENQSS